jgi:hypothetical protein
MRASDAFLHPQTAKLSASAANSCQYAAFPIVFQVKINNNP